MTEARALHARIDYPESDGKPMAETDDHRRVMMDLIDELTEHFEAFPDVYVSGNILLYYLEGDPTRSISPDVLVSKGLPKAKETRRIYKTWDEGKAPDVVFEITSRSTRQEDLRTKRELYERLRVKEYFLFDPLQEYLRPRLQGHRLAVGGYERIEPSAERTLWSEELRLELRAEGKKLELVDPATGERLLPNLEARRARRRAEARARQAEAQAAQAEARAAQAEARAQAEAEARQAVEAELARLLAELGRRE